MRKVLIAIPLMLLLFSSAAYAISLSFNQCYNLDTGDLGTCNATMDIRCTKAYDFTNAYSTLAPVNKARVMVDFSDNLKLNLANETNINDAYLHRWGTDSVILTYGDSSGGASTKCNAVFVVTNKGNYARLINGGGFPGDCTFTNINYTSLCTQNSASNISTTPNFPGSVYSAAYPSSTVSVYAFNTQGILFSAVDGGYMLTNDSTFMTFDRSTFAGISKFTSFYDAYYNVFIPLNVTWSTGTTCPSDSCSASPGIGEIGQLQHLTCGQQVLTGINYNDSLGLYPPKYSYYCLNNGDYNVMFNQPLSVDNTSLYNNMLALLHLEEDGASCPLFVDSSGHDNGGICAGSSLDQVGGVFGYGQYINYTATRIINLINLTDNPVNFSVSIWAKPSPESYHPDQQNVMVTKSSSWLIWQNANDEPFLWVWDQDFNLYTGSAATNVTGYWHNIAFTVNDESKTARLYVDGNLWTTISMPTYVSAYPNNEAVLMGLMGGYDQQYNGALDEFAYWNRTLTDAEILEVYQKKGQIETYATGTGAGFSVNLSQNPTLPQTRKNFRFNYMLYNYTSFFVITGVTNSPINPVDGQNVTVTFQTSLPSDTKIFYRYRNYSSGDSLANYTAWNVIISSMAETYHSYDIPGYMIIDNKYYQYYVQSGNINDTRGGLYYNFTVGAAGQLGPPGSVIPVTIDTLQRTGICSGSDCAYIFGMILLIFIGGFAFIFGGFKMGIAALGIAVIVFSVRGLLPWYLLIPVIVVAVIFVIRKLDVFGSGHNG